MPVRKLRNETKALGELQNTILSISHICENRAAAFTDHHMIFSHLGSFTFLPRQTQSDRSIYY